MTEKKYYFYLLTAELSSRHKNEKESIRFPISTIVPWSKNHFTQKDLESLVQKLSDAAKECCDKSNYEFKSYELLALSYLGHMTKEEFSGKNDEVHE